MQVTLDARALKPFTRALACLSKYGDEMIIHAGNDSLVLSSINMAKTAYCSFSYRKHFFQRYSAPRSTQANTAGPSRVNGNAELSESAPSLRCQLQTKALLTILRHRNTDKTAEKCELTIIDGIETPEEELRDNEDTLESRLIVRLHCKHGIVKTHRLLLNNPSSDEAPVIPTNDDENRIMVQPRAVKEMIEHFPNSKGPRSDPELVWCFDEDEVRVKSMEKGIDARGKSQLATELILGADEFDSYHVQTFPLSIGFFLKEFNATITLADALNTPIDFRFTTPDQPICLSIDADACSMLFIIATKPVREDVDQQQQQRARKSQNNGQRRPSATGMPAPRKRAFEDETNTGPSTRPRTAASDAPRPRTTQQSGRVSQQLPMSSAGQGDLSGTFDEGPNFYGENDAGPAPSQPLFLASQLSAADIDAIRESGLGIEDMDADEFAAMLDGDGEEVEVEARQPRPGPAPETLSAEATESRFESESLRDELEYDELDEDIEMGPTQFEGQNAPTSEKAFRPLFED